MRCKRNADGPPSHPLGVEAAGGCTVMLALGSASAGGRSIMAKNRDVEILGSPEIIVLGDREEGNGYLGIATEADSSSLTLAVNDKGLIVNTAGRYFWEPHNRGINSGVIIRRCMQLAGSAGEAAKLIRELVLREGKSKNASAFACLDAAEAYVVEAYRRESVIMGPLRDTVLTYGNFTISEEMKALEKRARGVERARRARELLEREQGGATLPLMIAACRDHERPPDFSLLWDDYNVCTHGYGRDTRGSGVCVVDGKYPGLLSVLWAALNPPCRTPYLPFYTGINKIPLAFATARAYEAFFALGSALEKAPAMMPEVRRRWEQFEGQAFCEAAAFEERARQMADAGRPEEAAELLTEFTASCAEKALREAEKITATLATTGAAPPVEPS